MSEFAGFATRFHKLKQDLQEIEESRYARLRQRETLIQSEWKKVHEAQQQNRLLQARAQAINLWHAYEKYHESLEQRKIELEREWEALKEHVSVQQVKLQDAYIEQEKWSQIADDVLAKAHLEELRIQQIEADDEALKRFRKADL
ncbi:hypothetical protein [Alicyclobacillus dauci]|uniref:Flagellar FliJ protein n=1 Tax=Alicyclobacillus dauci TaxID=1475485 RepID=A0ABY6YXS1_9BACL|nr:hypothetical protein [Alicyclobacillus dauci]WAH35404.1 hypothetical protein NZD86_13970 [Alicyclobacillus dauci]